MSQLITLDAAASPDIAERKKGLDAFFKPKSVAVIGATEKEGHPGRALLFNLISHPFGGTVYPVNPKRSSVLGIRSCKTIADVPEPVDLALLITPAESIPDLLRECGHAGVGGAIIYSSGFRESGERGLHLEEETLRAARETSVRVIGPSSLGLMRPVTGLNATFAPRLARPGSVALLSQSGAICAAVLDWAKHEQVGFSTVVSAGAMLDVDWGTLIDYIGNDYHTRSIVLYMESLGDARSFLSAARETALDKPILVIKAGRSNAAASIAESHTGLLAGSDAVYDAAFRRVGVVRIDQLSDIFHVTEVLASQPRPSGPRLAMVTNAGGPAVLATDTLLGLGSELARLAPDTVDALDKVLPPHSTRSNPVDLQADAGPETYEAAVAAVAKDRNTDGLLVIMTPQMMSDPVSIAHRLVAHSKLGNKPILASWMGGERAKDGEIVLAKAGIPTFPFPDDAVRAFHYMWKYSYNLRALYETPVLAGGQGSAPGTTANLVEAIRSSGRTQLTEFETKKLLQAYGMPVVETRLASSADEAVALAEITGYPVVLKVNSQSVLHKAAVGGVKLGLRNADDVRRAYQQIQESAVAARGLEGFSGVTVQPMVLRPGYELILGSKVDPQFGPVLLFGSGGAAVEVINDSVPALPPLNTTLARRWMEQTRIYQLMKRAGSEIPLSLLEQLLVRFSRLVLDHPSMREIEINPLHASAEGFLALDAIASLWDRETPQASIPKPCIRPYPMKYVGEVALRQGLCLNVRPIRPEDEPKLIRFHATLSEESVYRRYFTQLKIESRTQHERLTRLCFIDYGRQMAVVAETCNPDCPQAPQEIVGVGRLVKEPLQDRGEVAAIVSDSYQGKGVGRALVERCIQFARDEKLRVLTATVLTENVAMRRLLESVGFVFHCDTDPEILCGEMLL